MLNSEFVYGDGGLFYVMLLLVECSSVLFLFVISRLLWLLLMIVFRWWLLVGVFIVC